eukprot:4353092-Heterocapsa_arctica.AAC.1
MKRIQEKAPVRKKKTGRSARRRRTKSTGQKPVCMENTVLLSAKKGAGNVSGANGSPPPTWVGRDWFMPNA